METPTPSRSRAEVEFLRCCARTRLHPRHLERMDRLAGQPMDWSLIGRMAITQRVYPVVYANINARYAEAVPTTVLTDLEKRTTESIERNADSLNELLHLLRLLRAHGIPVIPFKGPMLTMEVYGNLCRRVYHDLDLLIRPEDFFELEVLLLANGYTHGLPFGRSRKTLLLHLENEFPFVHPSNTLAVDLHTSTAPRRHSAAIPFETLWERGHWTVLDDVSIRTLAPSDRLLLLSQHGTKHHWLILKFVCDIMELIQTFPELDWGAVVMHARQRRTERILHLALRLAHDVMDAPLPAAILRETDRDPSVALLASQLTEQLFADTLRPASYLQRHRFQLVVRQTLASKVRYAGSTLVFNRLSRQVLGIMP